MPWLTPSDGQEILVPYNLRYVAQPNDSTLTIAYRFLGERDKAWMLDRYNRLHGKPPRRGKKLREKVRSLYNKASKEGAAPLKKAIGLLKQLKRARFDETVELHMSLGIDATQSDQMIRGSVALPHGVGKVVRVLVFCQGDNVAKAKDAGADFAGSDELIKKIQGEGWLEFEGISRKGTVTVDSVLKTFLEREN